MGDTIAIPSAFDRGLLLGVLVGEGHFGGDGKQPQLTLKLHIRHEQLLRHILTICPSGRLYGPYHHADRAYFQLMYRGKSLRDHLIPLLDELPWCEIDPDSFSRYQSMKDRYARFLSRKGLIHNLTPLTSAENDIADGPTNVEAIP